MLEGMEGIHILRSLVFLFFCDFSTERSWPRSGSGAAQGCIDCKKKNKKKKK